MIDHFSPIDFKTDFLRTSTRSESEGVDTDDDEIVVDNGQRG